MRCSPPPPYASMPGAPPVRARSPPFTFGRLDAAAKQPGPSGFLLLCAHCAALAGVCSQLSIPLLMVPINLALFAVHLCGYLLGWRLGGWPWGYTCCWAFWGCRFSRASAPALRFPPPLPCHGSGHGGKLYIRKHSADVHRRGLHGIPLAPYAAYGRKLGAQACTAALPEAFSPPAKKALTGAFSTIVSLILPLPSAQGCYNARSAQQGHAHRQGSLHLAPRLGRGDRGEEGEGEDGAVAIGAAPVYPAEVPVPPRPPGWAIGPGWPRWPRLWAGSPGHPPHPHTIGRRCPPPILR